MIRQDAEHLVGEELGHWLCHASETGGEERNGALLEEAERGANTIRGIRPRVVVVQPGEKLSAAASNRL